MSLIRFIILHVFFHRWGDHHAKEVETAAGISLRNLRDELKGEEEVAPLTAEKDVIAKNLAELLEILAQEGNWDLGARDDKRFTNIAF